MSVEVETFYERGDAPSPYLTRVSLPLGISIHVFHRGDNDPDPHDHKRGFITFPLVSYVEAVYLHSTGEWTEYAQIVRAWRPHFRRRTHKHRLLGKWSGAHDHETGRALPTVGPGEVATIVWWLGRKRATWGFWVRASLGRRVFVDWRDYVDQVKP